MKKTLYILMALMCLACCKKPTPVPPDSGTDPTPPGPTPTETLASKIAAEWHCEVNEIDADIYLSLDKASTFELYQKIGEGSYRLYKGTWSLNEDTAMMTGKYNDGTSWGSGYTVTLSEDGGSMTLDPSEDGEDQVYRKTAIPSEVKEKAVVIVKSEAGTGSPAL